MPTQACMGGWCTKRQHCPHYHSEHRHQPEERLCIPGEDGVGLNQPIRLHTPAGTWERPVGLMADAGVWDALG